MSKLINGKLIAEKIEKGLANREQLRQKAEKAKFKVKEFTWEKTDKVEELRKYL